MIDEMELRKAFGCFATGVAVITALSERNQQTPFGITVNSFTSVSLDPPLALWCLGSDSETAEQFAAASRYTVNFLAEDQQDVSTHFAQQGAHGMGQFGFSSGANGCPVLDGVVGYLDCELEQRIPAGDHIIMLGRVLNVHYSDAKPLLYACGGYNAVK